MTKRALLIGIGPSYPDPYKIYSPPNDVANWTRTLQGRSFAITTLLEQSATRTNILNGLRSFVASLYTGDSGVIGFFGHGSYVADRNSDETDGRDECYVSVDMQAVLDDDIRTILGNLRSGVKLDVVMDCCYAGTGTRMFINNIKDLRIHSIPGPLKSPKQPKVIVPVYGMNHRLWAACADNQLSWEVSSGGIPQALFSLYLCWAIRNYPTKTATELMNFVAPYVQAVVASQVPQLEGINLTSIAF